MQQIRRLAQERGQLTRPEIARATGLSLVAVHQLVKKLCQEGDMETIGISPSGGGRPAHLYRLRIGKTRFALFRLLRTERGQQQGQLELLNMRGDLLNRQQALFSHLSTESLDGWLDDSRRSGHLRRIVLQIPSRHLPQNIVAHLTERYACPVNLLTSAQALADTRDETATLCLEKGHVPDCSLRRQGHTYPSGDLARLPLPASWETMDYNDHTLLEEMISRLLLILSCTLAPERFVLHAPFWTPRLLRRIRFNTSAKMQGHSPSLHFRPLTETAITQALRLATWKV